MGEGNNNFEFNFGGQEWLSGVMYIFFWEGHWLGVFA